MQTSNQGRPYRSHLRPACDACRRRKSRCATTEFSDACLMCQVHGSQCIFVDGDQSRRRKVPTARRRATGHAGNSEDSINPEDNSFSMEYSQDLQVTNAVQSDSQTYNNNEVTLRDSAAPPSPTIERSIEGTRMSAMLAESGDSSTHIISPAIADDNEELDSYLSSDPAVGIRRITRTSSTSTNMGPPSRRVLFNTVLRKPLGINANQSIAAGKLEVIEKLLEPHVMDMINLHVTPALWSPQENLLTSF
ncbi:hypothetical protein KCU65_g9579, partial [Aureobasidium melanogenum]